MFIKKLIIVSILFFITHAGLSLAACSLESINNLSVNNQTQTDIPNIIRLQSILYINNLYDGPITGYYGNLTKAAVNQLKQSYDLSADGIVDSETIDILCKNYTLCPFKSLLKNGDEYPVKEIKFIQYFLRLLPNVYPEKLVTGYFGPKTESAVKRLQALLQIDKTGQIDVNTRKVFCNFFANLGIDNTNLNNDADNTTPIFKVVCVPSAKQIKTNETVTFMSQIIGNNNSPFKYIWNNKTANNQKTFETSFPQTGDHAVNLTVIDNQGNIINTTCKIKVSNTDDLDLNDSDDNFDIDIGNQEPEGRDNSDTDIDLNDSASEQAPNQIIDWLKRNWNSWCTKSVDSYTPIWDDNAYTCSSTGGLYSYEECKQIATNLYKTNLFSLKGNEPNIPMFTNLYCNTFTHQCVDSNYILKDSNSQPCNYYKGPYKYYSISAGGIDNDCQKNCHDSTIATNYSEPDKYGNTPPAESEPINYINYEPNSEDFQKCFPLAYNNGKNYQGNYNVTNSICGNLKLENGILKKAQFPAIQKTNSSSTNISLESNTDNSVSNQIDPPPTQTVYPKRYKCSGGIGCVACERNESCPYENYYQCLDYCWWEAGKSEVQRKTEQSDIPQDSGAIGAEEDSNSELGAEKYDGNKLSGKYRCAWSFQCIPCTNDQVKTISSCWFNSIDECKEQCKDFSN